MDKDKKEILDKFSAHLKENNLSDKSVRCYKNGLLLYFRFSDEISKERFKAFIASLENKGLKPGTIAVRISALNKFVEFRGDLSLKLKPPKIPRRLDLSNVPSEQEYHILLSYLKDKNIENYWWVRLFSCTGARVSELLQFTWEHVSAGAVDLKGKGNKYRRFFFPTELSEEMRKYAIKNSKTGIIVKNRYGKPMTARGIAQLLKEWAKKCNLDVRKFHPHAFRHFFAKMFLKTNKDIVQLSDFLGHENLETTRIYLQKTYEEQKQDYNKHVIW
jgi:site-specific recombinase XerD